MQPINSTNRFSKQPTQPTNPPVHHGSASHATSTLIPSTRFSSATRTLSPSQCCASTLECCSSRPQAASNCQGATRGCLVSRRSRNRWRTRALRVSRRAACCWRALRRSRAAWPWSCWGWGGGGGGGWFEGWVRGFEVERTGALLVLHLAGVVEMAGGEGRGWSKV